MKLRIKIDHTRCLATGGCVGLAPDLFTQNDKGSSLVQLQSGPPSAAGVLDDLTTDQVNRAKEAAMFCPPEAITVCDDETGEQYFP